MTLQLVETLILSHSLTHSSIRFFFINQIKIPSFFIGFNGDDIRRGFHGTQQELCLRLAGRFLASFIQIYSIPFSFMFMFWRRLFLYSLMHALSVSLSFQELKNLRPQLYSAAEYCENSYLRSECDHKQM